MAAILDTFLLAWYIYAIETKRTREDTTMATFYHVAPADYQDGDDLMCFNLLEERGYEPAWRWECEPVDTDVVCLFRADQLDEARDFIDEFQPNGRLLRVEIPEDADDVGFTRVSEGYTAVVRRIPACYVRAM